MNAGLNHPTPKREIVKCLVNGLKPGSFQREIVHQIIQNFGWSQTAARNLSGCIGDFRNKK